MSGAAVPTFVVIVEKANGATAPPITPSFYGPAEIPRYIGRKDAETVVERAVADDLSPPQGPGRRRPGRPSWRSRKALALVVEDPLAVLLHEAAGERISRQPTLDEWKRMKAIGYGVSGLIAFSGLTIGGMVAYASVVPGYDIGLRSTDE